MADPERDLTIIDALAEKLFRVHAAAPGGIDESEARQVPFRDLGPEDQTVWRDVATCALREGPKLIAAYPSRTDE